MSVACLRLTQERKVAKGSNSAVIYKFMVVYTFSAEDTKLLYGVSRAKNETGHGSCIFYLCHRHLMMMMMMMMTTTIVYLLKYLL